ncbi:hypothetical protein pdam_00010026 [Pocillopora damicornis]|uniref:Uncharacterized protein n=1 Tax=Pocillopora damicornis TaxID=46731 RepID=A0A3M6T4Y4_POCDA|nr:hypothetical protein pdam_00010026 [Pocillopora damicornis]
MDDTENKKKERKNKHINKTQVKFFKDSKNTRARRVPVSTAEEGDSIVNDPDLELLLPLREGFFNWTITFKRDSDFTFPMELTLTDGSAWAPIDSSA